MTGNKVGCGVARTVIAPSLPGKGNSVGRAGKLVTVTLKGMGVRGARGGALASSHLGATPNARAKQHAGAILPLRRVLMPVA